MINRIAVSAHRLSDFLETSNGSVMGDLWLESHEGSSG
jgi:hypothetical protein